MANTTSPFAPVDPLTGLPIVTPDPSAPPRGIPYKLPGLGKNRKRTLLLALPGDAAWIPPSANGLASLVVGDHWLRYDIHNRITAAAVESTITGASTVKLSIHDPELRLLNSGLLQQRCRIRLGGYVFELVRVKKQGYVLALEFEDAVVAELRTAARSGYKTWKAGTISAVGAIRWFLSEKAKGADGKMHDLPGVTLYAPVDPGGGAGAAIPQHSTSVAASNAAVARDPGLAHKNVKVKGAAATSQQTQNINVVLKTILAFSPRPTTAELVMAVMCVTAETSAGNPSGGSGSSVGIFQQTPEGGYTGYDRTDIVRATQEFYKRLHKITTNPAYKGTPLYAMVQAVQGSGAGKASNGASNYGPWEGEAKNTVGLFLGPDAARYGLGVNAPDLLGKNPASNKPHTFHRGSPHTPEDSWTAMQRIAREVNYRCFVVGEVLYFMGDRRLLAGEPRLSLNMGVDGVHKLDYDIDVGKRVSTVDLEVDTKAWSCPPGSVIDLHDLGPANGSWLVDTVSADLKKPSLLTVKLTRPKVPLKEAADPTPTSSTGSVVASDGSVLPTSGPFAPSSPLAPGGGGASAPGTGGGSFSALITGAKYVGPDQGIDFTGAGPLFALADGVVTRVAPGGTGWPGIGAILVYQMTSGSRSGQYVYMAEDITIQPGIGKGVRIKKGQQIAYATGSGQAPGIEVGFAQDGNGAAFGTIYDGKQGGPPPVHGWDMQAFVQGLSK